MILWVHGLGESAWRPEFVMDDTLYIMSGEQGRVFACPLFAIHSLFQIIFKVARDAFVQVYHILTKHNEAFARIGKEVGLRTGVFASAQESQTVLWHADGIVIANDDLETSFQVFGLIE